MPVYFQLWPRFITVNLWRLCTVAKSRRNNYNGAGRDLWAKNRPMSWSPSNKWSKTMSHRIERAWVAEAIYREIQKL